MTLWFSIALFAVAVTVLVFWLIWAIRMDRIAQQDADDWRELTRPANDRRPPL